MNGVEKVSSDAFAAFLIERQKAKDGYIMGATGQDPKKWKKDSWWFAQYKSEAQHNKALYWREHAERVWDCNGLAEGYYADRTGRNINTYARLNYAKWCGEKGRGMIPADRRMPGAAVFWGNSAANIHHVAFLVEPVTAGKPEGDWYMVEARGVMIGVVKTKLYARKPDFWGLMTEYFDYNDKDEVDVPMEKVQVSAPELNVYRSAKSSKKDLMMICPSGFEMELVASEGDWGRFRNPNNGAYGYALLAGVKAQVE